VDIDPLSTDNYISPTGVNSTVCLNCDTEICVSEISVFHETLCITKGQVSL